MGQGTMAPHDEQHTQVLFDAMREAGLQVDKDAAERIHDYLKNKQLDIADWGRDATDSWHNIANSAVQNEGKGSPDFCRISTTERDTGGFAYVCLSEAGTRDLIQALEQSLTGRRR